MQLWHGLDHTNDKQKYNYAIEIQFVANTLPDKIYSNCTPSVRTRLHLVVITDGGGVGGVTQALADILAEDLAIRVGYNSFYIC